MKITNDTIFKISNQQVTLAELLEKAGRISSKKLCAHLKQQGITFERSLRIDALKATLRIPVAIRRKENANLLDKVYQRLSWFSVLSETQLINYLAFFNHAPLTAQYIENFWKAVLSRLNSAQLVSFGKFLLLADEDFAEVTDIVEYNQRLNPLFYDYSGQIDGLTPAQLRPVLYNSSTVSEIKEIGLKYGVKIPGTINKADLLKAFKEIAQARGLLSEQVLQRLQAATVKDIEQLAAELGINIATKLNKEGIVEYLLQKAPQVSAIYSVPLSDNEYLMDPPEDDVTDEEIAAYHRSSREFTVSEQLEFLLYLPGERLAEFFSANGIRFERRMRMDVLKRVLSPAVINRSREKSGGLDRTYAKLMWFTAFGETQLINMLMFFKSGELKARFLLELLTEMVKALSSSGAYDEELEKLHALALDNVAKNGGSLPDIVEYNTALNAVFYDETGKIDGLTPIVFRKVKYNSSTIREIGEIADKFGVDVPDKMEREDLAALIVAALKADGKHTIKEEEKILKLPFRAMIGYAKNYKLDVELGLNKEELIEFILKNAAQTAADYTAVKSYKEIKEAEPPQASSAQKLLNEYESQQKYTIVFERLGAEMFFDNDESYIVAAGEINFGQETNGEADSGKYQDDIDEYQEMLEPSRPYGIAYDKKQPPKADAQPVLEPIPKPILIAEDQPVSEPLPEPVTEPAYQQAPEPAPNYVPEPALQPEADYQEYQDWDNAVYTDEQDSYNEQDYNAQDEYREQDYNTQDDYDGRDYNGREGFTQYPYTAAEQYKPQAYSRSEGYYAPPEEYTDNDYDDYEIISDSTAEYAAHADSGYTMFYVGSDGKAVKKHEGYAGGAADGSVNVTYHTQPEPMPSDKDEMETLLQEVAALRERYAQLKANGSAQDKPVPQQALNQEQSATEEMSKMTAEQSISGGGSDVKPVTDGRTAKKTKKKKSAAKKTVGAILIAIAAIIVLSVIYSVVTCFAEIAFLQPVNDAINSITVADKGLLEYLHGIIEQIVTAIKSLF